MSRVGKYRVYRADLWREKLSDKLSFGVAVTVPTAATHHKKAQQIWRAWRDEQIGIFPSLSKSTLRL